MTSAAVIFARLSAAETSKKEIDKLIDELNVRVHMGPGSAGKERLNALLGIFSFHWGSHVFFVY